MDLVNTLKDFRRDNNLEQEDLAKLLDTTQQTISNWESGTMPRVGALRRITHLLTTYKKGADAVPYAPPPPPTGAGLFPTFTNTMVSKDQLAAQGEEPSPSTEKPRGMGRTEPFRGLKAAMQVFEDQMCAAIPSDLPFERDVLAEFQGIRAWADLLTSKTCVEIATSMHGGRPMPLVVDSAIHKLNTLRRIHERNGVRREIYALIVVVPAVGKASSSLLNRVNSAAALHDVSVAFATSPEECALEIVGLERAKYYETIDEEGHFESGYAPSLRR